MSVSVNEVLDMWIGNSERNMHEVFETARRQAPCVVFLDELDALGAKRSRTAHSGMRNVVNQLLSELDGIDSAANEGVFVLAATNVPWDVDNALRPPGRLDRTILVLPPDGPAREAILRYHLRDRPIENVDLSKLVKVTGGLSGADLAHAPLRRIGCCWPGGPAVHRAKGDSKRPGPGAGASGIDAERVQTESGEVRVATADVDL